MGIHVLQAGAQVDQATTGGDGAYSFVHLSPGAYTISEVPPPWLRWSTTPDEVTVEVLAGQRAEVDFGDWNGRPAWLPLIVR